MNATFAIVGYDSTAKEWGIAVATNNIYVGNSAIYIVPGQGAFATIAETEPLYATNGFDRLKTGNSVEEAILYTMQIDQEAYYRQVAGVDSAGKVYAFTGSALKNWPGIAAHRLGKGYVVMGNQLADGVLDSMAHTFENVKGTLAERLLKSLLAGQEAGGQITGKQSSALVVKGLKNAWYNQIDLRVDHSRTPFEDLRRLLDYHYGRITLNQAIFAIKAGKRERGEQLLHKAGLLLDGWNGISGKIAMAYVLLGDENKAVSVICKAVAENPQWIENVPAFYCLYKHPQVSSLKAENTFSLKDMHAAIGFMIEVNKNSEAIALARNVLEKYPNSSFTHYLLGRSYLKAGDKASAISSLEAALRLDEDNAEAAGLLKGLQ
jgi:uncharacterized Ntn-hydrolase superfamily protein